MARGWESKSIEEQQEAAAHRRMAEAGPPVSPEEAERRRQLEALQLAHARVLADLQRACQPAHRGMLEHARADLESKIEALKTR